LEFHYFEGGIRGGIGIVEQQDHPLNGDWIGFCVRDGTGTIICNFSNNLAESNIRIGTAMLYFVAGKLDIPYYG